MLPAVLLTAATGNLCCRETESNASCNTINKQKCKSRNAQEDLTLPPWTLCHKDDGIKFIHQFQFVVGRNVKIIITFLSRWQSQHGSLSSRLMGHLPKVFDYRPVLLMHYGSVAASSTIIHVYARSSQQTKRSRFMRRKSQGSSITSPLTPLHRTKHSSLMGSMPKGLRLPPITLITLITLVES